MKMKIFGLIVLFVCITFTGCVTSTKVLFETDEPGATIFVDGKNIGTTPIQVKMSNGIWEDPDVLIKREGYIDQFADVKKEIKPVNLVCGVIIWWPSLLWSYGPKTNQYYILENNKK